MDQITIRMAQESDEKLLVSWFLQPGVLKWFPLTDLREIEDASRIWMSYIKQNAVLTALYNEVACGTALLYIQPFKKLSHQCLLAIIVDEKYRGKGVGTKLLQELINLAKHRFHMELVHLEVYEGNPAIRLYERFGFVEYGRQKRFIKDQDHYYTKIFMQKIL